MKDRVFDIQEILDSKKDVGLFKELCIRIFGKKIIGWDVTPIFTSKVVMHRYNGINYMLTPIKYIKWDAEWYQEKVK